MWTLKKQFRFEASHQLPHHDGKCRRLHGHSWVGYVVLRGYELQEKGCKQGMLVDFATVGAILKKLVDETLDHYHLNESTGLENPTCEHLARWIHDKLREMGVPFIYSVIIEETCTSSCEYSIYTSTSAFP